MKETKSSNTFYIDPETAGKIRSLADQQDRPITRVIKSAVDQYAESIHGNNIIPDIPIYKKESAIK